MHYPLSCSFSRLVSGVLVGLALLVGTVVQGHTTVLYTGAASATVTIDNISNRTNPGALAGLLITGDAAVSATDSMHSGNAFADASGDALVIGDPGALGTDDGVFLESLVTGDSVTGFASSLHSADGFLSFENTSINDTFDITLAFVYDLTVDAAVMDALTETALASASVIITAAGELLVDSALFSDGGTLLDGDTGLFTFVLAPGELAEVAALVDVLGSASASPVPEPASLALFGTGLLALLALAYSRRFSTTPV